MLPASVCGSMENDGPYDFGDAFARLTCMFEDAAGVAIEGQAAGLRVEEYHHLAAGLQALMEQAGVCLKDLAEMLEL